MLLDTLPLLERDLTERLIYYIYVQVKVSECVGKGYTIRLFCSLT